MFMSMSLLNESKEGREGAASILDQVVITAEIETRDSPAGRRSLRVVTNLRGVAAASDGVYKSIVLVVYSMDNWTIYNRLCVCLDFCIVDPC